MKHLNFLSSLGSQSGSHRVVTLASTVGSPSAHRRGVMLKLLTVLVLILTLGVGQMWGAKYSLTPDQSSTKSSSTTYITSLTEFTYPTNGISWKMNYWNPSNLQVKVNQSSAASEFRFYNTSAFAGKITKVVVTFSALSVSDASKLMFLGGTSEQSGTSNGSAGTWNGNAKTLTWTPASNTNYTYFAFYQNGKAASGTNNLASSDAIVVTYLTAVTLDKNGGSANGAIKFDHEATECATSSFTPVTLSNYNCTGYWTEQSGGTKILNADGSIAAANITVNTVPYTDANKKWVYTAGTLTLYAQWEAAGGCSSEVAVSAGSTTNGSFTLSASSVCADGDGGEVAITSVTPADDCYEFDEITATVGTPDNTNMKVTGITAATEITVTFKKKTVNTYIDEVQDNGSQEFCAAHNAPTLTDKAVNTTGTAQEQHFHFVGWVTEANRYAATDQNVIAGGTEMTVTGTTYYAVWAKQASAASLESDVINYAATSSDLSGKGSNWVEFTINGSTGAKYYIRSMGTSDGVALQWNANGYLYCSQKPTSGAKLKSVSVTTTANKNIGVYADDNVYSAAPSGTALNTLAATSAGAAYNFTSSKYAIALKGTASSTSITSITITYGEDATYNHYRTLICDELAEMSKSVINPSQEYLTLKWSALTGVTSWSVQYKVQGAADNTYANVTTSSKTTSDGFNLWTVTGLQAGTTYTFKIVATAFGDGVCTDVNTWTVDGATENNYEVTAQSNNTNYGTVVLSGSTITATPAEGYRVSKTTPYEVSVENAVDVAQDGNVFTISNLSNSCTITINFEAIPTYAVNWYVNGTSQKNQTYREGTLVSTIMADAPSVLDNALNASCGSTKFIGWVTAEYKTNDGTETTYNNNKVDGEATLSDVANYYAMFATATTDEWNRVETLDGITEGTYVIVSKAADDEYYMLPNATNTSSAQVVSNDYKVTRNNDGSKITSTVPAGAEWSFTINNQGKYIIKNAEDKNLYATSANNGLRVGATEDTWTISVNGSAPAYLMTESNNTRCCGIYSSQDWRSYANTEQGLGNYPDGGKVYLYKHTAIYGEYRTGCTCNTVTVAIGTHTNGTLTLNDGDENVSNETCTDSEVEVRVAPNATYQFAATNAVTFSMGNTGLTAPDTYAEDNGARVYTVSIPKGTAAGTITVSASFESLPKYGIDLSGVSHLTNLTSSPTTEALGGAIVTLSYDAVESGYTFLNWIVKGATTDNTIPVTNNQFQMPNDEGVVVTADIRENVSVTFYVGTTPYGEAAGTYQGGTISLPATDPTESFDATNYPYFIGWSATNFGAATTAPALVDGSETINASTSYYAVFVDKDPSVMTNNYQKIAYTSSLNEGNYVIVAVGSTNAYAMTGTASTYNIAAEAVTIGVNDVITTTESNIIWAISKNGNNYKLKNGTNWASIHYDGSQYTNLVLTSTDAENTFTILQNGTSDAYIFKTTDNTIAKNEIEYYSKNTEFSAFGSQDANYPIYLYKQLAQVPTKWATKQIAEITVSFNDNVAEEDITVPGNQVVDSGDDLDLSGFTPGARAGYQFAGWSLTTNGEVIDELTNITQNTPLYAIWTANPNCTIKFSVRGTVKNALQETILQGQTFSDFASKEIAEADEVEGYDFIGWASAAQLAETTDAITPMTSYTPEVEESASEVTVYALYNRSTDAAEKVDHVDRAFTGRADNAGYDNWSGKQGTSGAVYAGNSAGGNNAIQLRSSNSSAIVTTTSAGKATKVVLTWNSGTAEGRTVDVYGKDAAYEDASSLYSAAGTKIGSIVYGTSTELTISNEYAYIGLRSNSNALYLDEIAITWSSSTTYYTTRPTQLWAVDYDLNGGAWKSGEGCADGTVQEGEYTVCTDIPENGEDKLFDKWQINGVDVTTETVNITAATTFTAVWKERGHGKVTYSANGGVISGSAPAAADVWEDEKVTVVANTFFTNPGYSFGGWNITYNDGENIQTITPDANNQFDMPAYDVTIAAVWSRKSTDKWVRVTSAGQLVAGEKYVIANVDATYAMAEQRTNNRGAIAVDQVGDARFITISDNVAQLTLGGNATDGWTFQDGTKYLQATNLEKNYLYTDDANDDYSNWTIAFSVDDNSNPITTITANDGSRNYLRYNENVNQQTHIANPIFSCYASGSTVQNPVNLYIKAPKVDVTTEVNASVITAEGTDVTVKEGGILNIDVEKSVGDVHVENGGQMALTQNMEAHDLYLESKAGQSAQVSGVDKITLSGNVYIDIQLCNGSLDANYWYSIAVPFDVNLNDGVFLADGMQLTNHSDFEVWGYNTQKRADTQLNGWERVTDNMMHAGKAYLIGFNPGQPNVIRLKAAEGWQDNLFDDAELEVTTTTSGGTTHDNWNGLANPTMRYMGVNKATQVFDNDDHNWDSYDPAALDFNFVVGTAFFVQSDEAVAVVTDNNSHSAYRAPQRAGNEYAYAVRITREGATEFDNQMVVRASEDATNAYEQGHDMLTMNNATSNTAALLWTENYGGKRLAIEEAPLVNNQAMYDLRIYAPAAGTYSLSAAAKEGADLYVTYEGAIVWNLSLGDYEMDLVRGTTTGYGLLLVVQPNQMPTGVENGELLNGENGVQKILLNGQLYILRDGHLYDAVGKEMK